MSKYKFISYLLILLGVLVIVGSGYLLYSYASMVISAIVNFISTNDYSKLTQCGVNTPPEFNKVKADFATVILPFFYVGLPVILILVSYLMFMAGFYFHRGKQEDDAKKHEQLEREMVHKIVNKMQTEKPAPQKPMPAKKGMGAEPADQDLETDLSQDVEGVGTAEEEPEEEEPPPKPMMKKKK